MDIDERRKPGWKLGDRMHSADGSLVCTSGLLKTTSQPPSPCSACTSTSTLCSSDPSRTAESFRLSTCTPLGPENHSTRFTTSRRDASWRPRHPRVHASCACFFYVACVKFVRVRESSARTSACVMQGKHVHFMIGQMQQRVAGASEVNERSHRWCRTYSRLVGGLRQRAGVHSPELELGVCEWLGG